MPPMAHFLSNPNHWPNKTSWLQWRGQDYTLLRYVCNSDPLNQTSNSGRHDKKLICPGEWETQASEGYRAWQKMCRKELQQRLSPLQPQMQSAAAASETKEKKKDDGAWAKALETIEHHCMAWETNEKAFIKDFFYFLQIMYFKLFN